MRKIILLIVAAFGIQAIGQTTGKIVDATSGDAIPYANVQSKSESLISNSEGYFTISEANSADDAPLVVSYIGYASAQLTVGELKAKQLTIRLQPSVFELDEVHVSKLPTANEIMAGVRKNLNQNYKSTGRISENNVFIRESNMFAPKKLDVEIEKSTGFSKSSLKSVNAELSKFTSKLISHPPREYTDMLCNFYISSTNTKAPYKLDVIKATKLKDENKSVSLDGLQDNATKLLLKHLDTTKYYRIKSGWFGSRDTVSLRKDFNKSKNQKKPSEVASAKSRLTSFASSNNLLSQSFEFIHKPDYYEYTYDGAVFLEDGNFAYVVSFKPDRGKAKYTGKLYVSQADFAVVRADYALAEGKKVSGLNLKLLLGVKVAENLHTGTIIYKQRSSGEGYYLQYASREEGQYIYVHRPLKFIELSEKEKDVVAFDLKVEGNILGKTEYLNRGRNEISDADFENAKETEFKYLRIKQYDPAIWKDYGAIEPLQEMKRYKLDETQ